MAEFEDELFEKTDLPEYGLISGYKQVHLRCRTMSWHLKDQRGRMFGSYGASSFSVLV